MKTNIVIALLIGASFALNFFLITENNRLGTQVGELNANMIEIVNEKDSVSQVIELSASAFRQSVKENEALKADLKEAGIKIKKLQGVVKIEIRDRIVTDTFYVPAADVYNKVWFNHFKSGCLSFDQEISTDEAKVVTSNIVYENSIQVLDYKNKVRTGEKFLWVFPKTEEILDIYIKPECGSVIYKQYKIK